MAKMKRERKYDKNPVCNLRLRALIAGCGLRYGEIAKEIYISQSTLSQWFQHEMKPWQRKEVVTAIAKIIWERGYVGDEDQDKGRETFIRDYVDSNLGSDMDGTSAQVVVKSV